MSFCFNPARFFSDPGVSSDTVPPTGGARDPARQDTDHHRPANQSVGGSLSRQKRNIIEPQNNTGTCFRIKKKNRTAQKR